MDVFELRDTVVADYSSYVRSFVTIRDDRINRFVDERLNEGRLWPDPLVQLNPAFAPGQTIDELVASATLHPEMGNIFRRDKHDTITSGAPLRLHRHQEDAVRLAASGKSYVLTTGTGSGKSLAYFIPIIDHVLRHGSGRGTRAIVVYPMNALCNSQEEELEKFLHRGYEPGRPPVSFARYTGQESDEERLRIAEHPPDILLTNYVMLELLLTRSTPVDRRVLGNATGLEFLVLDELHTYRGRQGADVAMLVRRVQNRVGAPSLRFVGTSATIAGDGNSRRERAGAVADVASRLFGTPITVDEVISETLESAAIGAPPEPGALADRVRASPRYAHDAAELKADPVARWVEGTFGITRDAAGDLVRQVPTTIPAAAAELGRQTGVDQATCETHLKAVLMAGYLATDPATSRRVFAFRLHQFVSRGDTVYASLGPAARRHLTLDEQRFVPGSERSERLFPLAFCRECGEEYAVVEYDAEDQSIESRRLREVAGKDQRQRSGFLYFDHAGDWGDRPLDEQYPEDWLETAKNGSLRLKAASRNRQAIALTLRQDGSVDPSDDAAARAWFVPAPFRFCLHCGVAYSQRGGDFGRLAELATEGRSTATTVLAVSVVRQLKALPTSDLPASARKLLSFTDNRQDASLQSGHLNDFVQVATLRGALARALAEAGPHGLHYNAIATSVTAALALEPDEYMGPQPDANVPSPRVVNRARRALEGVVGYLVYQDLRRGWRVTTPNLEQTGLLRIDYDEIDQVCADDALWQGRHQVLASATVDERERAVRVVLDYFRRELAIKVSFLDRREQDKIRNDSFSQLSERWAFGTDEQLDVAPAFAVGKQDKYAGEDVKGLTGRGTLGRFLLRRSTWESVLEKNLKAAEFEPLAADLFAVLASEGYLAVVDDVKGSPAYQLQADQLRWRIGDGTPPPADPLRVSRAGRVERQANEFFATLYGTVAQGLDGMRSSEHTAQVPSAQREEREQAFRQGTLPVLFCSPTMELGVDIADLNVVNMRNVPPTPANYAQRSGRAGRSGQPALVLTYCSSLSPHDQYFFQRPEQMVAGQVSPPRIELANEDLIRAHMHAVWLGETGAKLGRSVKEVIDLIEVDDLPLLGTITEQLRAPAATQAALARCGQILASLEPLIRNERWYRPEWLSETIHGATTQFDRAANRWRTLYRSAMRQQETQNRIVLDHSVTSWQRQTAERLRREAETQIELLTDDKGRTSTDFYSYRYFASEGFLPGYNFPRLPLSAYLPARRVKSTARDEFVSRGRFVAISEFGPRNMVYYEGARYRIERVILPPSDGTDGARTTTAKLCTTCGYVHAGSETDSDVCANCGAPMTEARPYDNLFRLQNVATRRVDRITSDEEERQRQGYDLLTAFQFGRTTQGYAHRSGTLALGGETIAKLTYAPTATLWRLNLGWTRRENKQREGFMLDMATGNWARSDQEATPDEQTEGTIVEPAMHEATRVVPFVEDTRNALLLDLDQEFRAEQERRAAERAPGADASTFMVSLTYALKRGIEVAFQLEDNELGVDLLPNAETPRSILFYEASEGGAGVLARLVDDTEAIRRVAGAALTTIHYVEGVDQGKAPKATENCEAACYSCLMSYANQRYHRQLDRQAVAPTLLMMRDGQVSPVGDGMTRAEQRDDLLGWCESSLEREFVQFLYGGGYRLPSRAQEHVRDANARPDFTYHPNSNSGDRVAVFVDGPVHDHRLVAERDGRAEERLLDAGWEVVRVGLPQTWTAAMGPNAWVFGIGTEGTGE